MTAPDDRSDRRSGRVEAQATPYTEFAGLYTHKGPESMGTGRGSGAASSERRTGRVSSRQLDDIDRALTSRDRAVMALVDRFRYLSTRQIQYQFFADAASSATAARLTRRLMYRLAESRVVEPLERRIGGFRAGSAGYVWRLGPAGDGLLKRSTSAPRDRRKEPGERTLRHTLAIVDVYCQLVGAARMPGFELLHADPEPISWRSYLGSGGSQRYLKPDLYAVTASGDYEDHWFIEVDRATESLPVVIAKCQQYELYRRTGREQQSLGLFPIVLWTVPDQHRVEQLRAGFQNAKLDSELFRVTTSLDLLGVVQGGAP